MPVYKVYIVNNYIFIQDTVTDEIISGHAKSVRVVPQLKVGGNSYKFQNTSDDVKLASVSYSSIKQENGTSFTNEAAWRTFYTQYTGTQATGGGGGSQSLSQVLAVSDRPRKELRVSDILTDGGNYDFVAGDEQKLIVLLVDNANDDEITMNVPAGSKEDAEYKILFTKGNNEFTNNKITYLNDGSGVSIYGRAIQNSDEDSIAVIKVMNDIVALSITYQSSNGDSALIYEGFYSQSGTDNASCEWFDGLPHDEISFAYNDVGSQIIGSVDGLFVDGKTTIEVTDQSGQQGVEFTKNVFDFAPNSIYVTQYQNGTPTNNVYRAYLKITIRP